MKAIFISDAHLRNPRDPNYQRLLDFLNRQQDLDGLFLLGDIFEFWLGYRHVVFSAYIPLLEVLRRLTESGTALYFVEGNHDFHLGPYFTETLRCTVIPEQQVIEWDGRKILLCHGDTLNATATYRRLRGVWRSRPIRWLSRIIHPDLVWTFALWLSSKSGKNSPGNVHQDPTPVLIPLAEQQAQQGTELILCGHYHHPLDLDQGAVRVIALGDWISQFSYAEMIDGDITLKQDSA